MIFIKTLSFVASREMYYHCYRITEHFIHSCFSHCMCDRYQGCSKGPEPVAENEYCCVCRTRVHYILGQLKIVKDNSFVVKRFYPNILRDLAEILSVDLTTWFWENDFF